MEYFYFNFKPVNVSNNFRQHSIKVDYIGADLLKVDEIEALVREIHQRYPAGIDILINNAGMLSVSNWLEKKIPFPLLIPKTRIPSSKISPKRSF